MSRTDLFIKRLGDCRLMAEAIGGKITELEADAAVIVADERDGRVMTETHMAELADLRSKIADLARRVGVDANAAVARRGNAGPGQ